MPFEHNEQLIDNVRDWNYPQSCCQRRLTKPHKVDASFLKFLNHFFSHQFSLLVTKTTTTDTYVENINLDPLV